MICHKLSIFVTKHFEKQFQDKSVNLYVYSFDIIQLDRPGNVYGGKRYYFLG